MLKTSEKYQYSTSKYLHIKINLTRFWYGSTVLVHGAGLRSHHPNSILWPETDSQERIRMILAHEGEWLLFTYKTSVFKKLSSTVFKIQRSIAMPDALMHQQCWEWTLPQIMVFPLCWRRDNALCFSFSITLYSINGKWLILFIVLWDWSGSHQGLPWGIRIF